jgi:hypothetical protein
VALLLEVKERLLVRILWFIIFTCFEESLSLVWSPRRVAAFFWGESLAQEMRKKKRVRGIKIQIER